MSATSPTTRRWMSPPPHYDTAQVTHAGTTLTPYLTLPYILSLAWLAYPIISLLFVAFRLAISSSTAQASVDDAKAQLLASCAAAEKAATTAASLPRYMAVGTNKQIAAAVNGTMNAARATLVLSLTIVEGIINFVIDIYRSTFFCFLELIVRGGLAVLISAVNDINNFLSNTFSSIRTTIQNDIQSINSAIQSAVDGINKINPFGNISAPTFSVPDLSLLENVTLPDSVQQALTSLNSSLPTVDELKNTIKGFVDTPFEGLKADINNTFAGLDFNAQTLFVPDQQTLSFCNEMDTSVVDDLGRDLVKITKIGIVILVILALLLLAAHCALEWYKWRLLQQHLEYTRQSWVTDPTMNNGVQNGETPALRMTDHNLLVLGGAQQHPLLTRISNQIAARLKLTPSQHTNLQWFFHYIFHPPVLAVFLIGFLGLLSVQIQLLAIHPIEQKFSSQVASSVSNFSNTIATSMNASMYNQSVFYANQINTQVNSTQTTINDGLFGWVNGTTTTLNNTLNEFYSDIQNAVSTVFNGTVLEEPVQEFIRCIIGSKVETIENALTFLHDNLAIDIPTMNESALVLSQADVDEASQPIAAAALGDGTDGNQGLVGKVVAAYVASLEKERLMFGIFIGLWGLVVVIALLIIFWHSYIKPRRDARKQRQFRTEHRDFASFVTPYKPDAAPAPAPAYANSTEKNIGSGTGEKSGGLFNIHLRLPIARKAQEYPQEHQHQRSWDSLLDSTSGAGRDRDNNSNEASASQSQSNLTISKPRKLMAIGSKAGRERFVSDEERARMRTNDDGSNDNEAGASGWMNRLTNVFRGKSSSSETDDDRDAHTASISDGSGRGTSSSKPRQRPNLTIRTSLSNAAFKNVSRDRLPTASADAPQAGPAPKSAGLSSRVQNNPSSAWSISPQPPRTLPWLPHPANTAGKRMKRKSKSQARFPGLPASPRRHLVGGPSPSSARMFANGRNGAGTAIGVFPTPTRMPAAATVVPRAAPVQTPYTTQSGIASGIPSYYHSSLPHYAHAPIGRESLLPENTLAKSMPRGQWHKRTSSVPLLRAQATPMVAKERYPFRTPFDDDARVKEQSEKPKGGGGGRDPFRTPFDDDAMVIPENWPQPPGSAGPRNLYHGAHATLSPGVNANPFSPSTPRAF